MRKYPLARSFCLKTDSKVVKFFFRCKEKQCTVKVEETVAPTELRMINVYYGFCKTFMQLGR